MYPAFHLAPEADGEQRRIEDVEAGSTRWCRSAARFSSLGPDCPVTGRSRLKCVFADQALNGTSCRYLPFAQHEPFGSSPANQAVDSSTRSHSRTEASWTMARKFSANLS